MKSYSMSLKPIRRGLEKRFASGSFTIEEEGRRGPGQPTARPAVGGWVTIHEPSKHEQAKQAKRDAASHRAKVNALLAQLDWVAPPAARDLDLSEPGTIRIKPGRERKLDWR